MHQKPIYGILAKETDVVQFGEMVNVDSCFSVAPDTIIFGSHPSNCHFGCSLASAIACNLARGLGMISAVKKANAYVEAGIKTAKDLGQGIGPINHFHSMYMLPFTP